MLDLLYRSFSALSGDRLAWSLAPDRLRILCYHGVCEDHLAEEPWIPSYFVTKSAFELHLRYLRRHARVLPLLEGVRRLREGSLPPRAVCLTFDDGFANNLRIALPLLEKYETPATVFLATFYTETSTFYPFVQLKLIRLWNGSVSLPEYKSTPVDDVLRDAAGLWSMVDAGLSSQQRETLRPLTINEVCSADGGLLQFAAHSHTHGIARNEAPGRRRSEVLISVRKVSEWTGRPVQIYSYPNGEPGDFGVLEWEALKAAGVENAVTGISGANRWPCNPLALKRYPLTMNHDESRFRAEATGFRHLMMSAAGRQPQ